MERQTLALSPLDHLMPTSYIIKLAYFQRSNSDIDQITSIFQNALKRTFDTLPILAGTVQLVSPSANKQRGSLCVDVPWNKIEDVLHFHDLTSSDLDYETLKRNNFPLPTANDHGLLRILGSRPNPFGAGNPVMMAQVNFIRNGIILAQFLHHSFTDGLGSVAVMELWAAFCKRNASPEKVIDAEMLDRGRLMTGGEGDHSATIREYVDTSNIADVVNTPERSTQGRSLFSNGYGSAHTVLSPPLKEVDSVIFFLPRSNLAALKAWLSASLASTSIPSNFISTNDALSALLFTCITEARRSVISTPSNRTEQTIPFGLTVSGRRLLEPPLPEKYVGNMSLFCYLDPPLHTVTTNIEDTAAIAQNIRKRLNELDGKYITGLIGALHTVEDVGKIEPVCLSSKDWPFMITPWTGQRDYTMDWGQEIGGVCQRVRLPKVNWPGFDGCVIILPELKGKEGIEGKEEERAGLEVMVGLQKDAMERLKSMEEWTRWAEWRCS